MSSQDKSCKLFVGADVTLSQMSHCQRKMLHMVKLPLVRTRFSLR
jgi:hypothetical protein